MTHKFTLTDKHNDRLDETRIFTAKIRLKIHSLLLLDKPMLASYEKKKHVTFFLNFENLLPLIKD